MISRTIYMAFKLRMTVDMHGRHIPHARFDHLDLDFKLVFKCLFPSCFFFLSNNKYIPFYLSFLCYAVSNWEFKMR